MNDCLKCPRPATHGDMCRDCYENSIMKATREQQDSLAIKRADRQMTDLSIHQDSWQKNKRRKHK